jgi:4-hydroxy-3-methylbut-2-enyl diphosphate reductase
MANRLGFCFGVKRAVDEIESALADGGEVWSIGMPIHNPEEVNRLRAKGLRVVEDAAGVPDGAKVLIRAHGESRAVVRGLLARGVQVADMTCPFVRRAQERAGELSAQGYHVVLLGDQRHPEIRAIMGCVDGPMDVVAGVAGAQKLPRRARVALISQTTQQEELLAGVAAALVPRAGELCVCNTVCKATAERQEAVRRLVGKVDGLALVGGRDSANTAKLWDIARDNDLDVLWMESASEVDGRWLEGKVRIGIAAGASTPEWLIMEVSTKIASM